MGTISWEEFVIGVRHILSVSGTIGDGWHFRGSLEEHCGGYLTKRMDYPVDVAEPTAASDGTRLKDDDDSTIDHDSAADATEPSDEQDPCSIDPDPSFRPVCREFHVLYSLAHAVPTLYLRAWRSDGSCVEAKELWSGLTAAEWRPSSDEFERLRSLTQQEHPFLGEPWYHLHPCRTADLMDLVASQNGVDGIDAKLAPSAGSRDDVYSCLVRLSEMEMVRAFTTRQPVVGTTGTTLQRNITIYVLVAGIAGGLLLTLAILLLCKYCSRLRSRTNRERNTTNPAVSGWGTEVSVALTSSGVSKVQHRLTGINNNKLTTSSTSTGPILVTTLSQPVIPLSGTLASPSAGHQHIGSSGSIGTNPSSIIKDDLSDSYVIQVEPLRVMTASPSSILGGADSWVSDESPTTHRGGLLTVSEERDDWTRREYQQSVDNSIVTGDDDNTPAVSPVIAAPADLSHRRSLRHAATHDDGSATSSTVSKRRLDWRNSHRNYRSAPTAAASRDSYALNYDTRRALRDYHQRSIEAGSVYSSPLSNRRVLHKRGGSMRETLTADGLDASSSCSSTATELAGNSLPSTSLVQQQPQHSRCQMMASPATKRWRCHTVDCPCSNNVTASPVNKDLILHDGALSIHRHSFPSSGELSSPSSSNRRRHYHQHRSEDQNKYFGQTKESWYEGYLNRSESLDWEGFETRAKTTSTKRDDAASVMLDVDGTTGQLQTASAGPAPRITIRYNDPGSLESVNEDNLFFCLEAGSKNEFRQRLEKTIDAQYRQVWELRANLEEHNDFYEPSSPEPETTINPGLAISDVESFDSNSESLVSEEEEIRTRNYDMITPAQDLSATCESKTPSSATILLAPTSSGSWKRQSYRSVSMNSRLPHQSGPIIPMQRSPQHQPQSSFDSIDTIETSSTEASRMDHVTTSFESSATDSTNGLEVTSIPPSVSHHRMLALRNDSGYRSLESAIVPTSSLAKTSIKGRTMSLSEDDLNDPFPKEADCQCRSQVLHEEKCERYKPIVFARCTRYGMKVRSASTSSPHPSAPPTGWRNQQRLHQHHSQQSLTRDYSIDERTDALFREFSRCDPVFDTSTSAKNVGGGSRTELRTTGFGHRSRWINQHQRHDAQHHYQHRFMSSDASDSLLQHCSLKE